MGVARFGRLGRLLIHLLQIMEEHRPGYLFLSEGRAMRTAEGQLVAFCRYEPPVTQLIDNMDTLIPLARDLRPATPGYGRRRVSPELIA